MLSENTYAEYVRLYADTILRIAVNYCKELSDAEDIVQEAFLKLYQTDTDFTDAEHVKRWLIRVTINACKNHLSCAWRRNIQPMGFTELSLALDHAAGAGFAPQPQAKPPPCSMPLPLCQKPTAASYTYIIMNRIPLGRSHTFCRKKKLRYRHS